MSNIDSLEKAFLHKSVNQSHEYWENLLVRGSTKRLKFDDLMVGDSVLATWDNERVSYPNPKYDVYLKVMEQVENLPDEFYDYFTQESSEREFSYKNKYIWVKGEKGLDRVCEEETKTFSKEEILEFTGGVDSFILLGSCIKE